MCRVRLVRAVFYLSIDLSIYLSIYLSFYLSIYLSIFYLCISPRHQLVRTTLLLRAGVPAAGVEGPQARVRARLSTAPSKSAPVAVLGGVGAVSG